ncbi:hypothetical protein AAEX28_15190 [Lentisphaerota bacterium WC36G]|nr:hypothetical protein LJT99_01955 [Lentisphaerae bacterium WC36]
MNDINNVSQKRVLDLEYSVIAACSYSFILIIFIVFGVFVFKYPQIIFDCGKEYFGMSTTSVRDFMGSVVGILIAIPTNMFIVKTLNFIVMNRFFGNSANALFYMYRKKKCFPPFPRCFLSNNVKKNILGKKFDQFITFMVLNERRAKAKKAQEEQQRKNSKPEHRIDK